jgi:mxaD protein
MIQVAVTKQINSPADKVWEKVASFSGIEDYSPIAKSVVEGNGVGAKRTCYMPDDAEIHEALSLLDHDNMHLEYEMFSGPFPIKNYKGKVTVKPVSDNTSEVTWGSEFELNGASESEIRPLFEGFYAATIDGLEANLNRIRNTASQKA